MLRPALLLLALLNGLVLAFNPIPEGQKYEVVFPRKLHAQHKRDTQGEYPDLVQYGLELNGLPLVLHLEKTEDLISENYTETHYLDDGTPVTTSPEEQDHCFYQGHVKNDNSSQVSLNACHGLSGIIMTQEQKFLIEPLNETESGAHAVYPYQALETPKTCGVDNMTFNATIMTKTSFSSSSAEKQKFLKSRKFIQLYMVADYSMFIKYNRNKDEIRKRLFGTVNFVNLVYKPLNTFVALTGLEIWDKGDLFKVDTSANINLNSFSQWRKEYLLPRKPNDNAQFITNTDFDGSTVGLAWVGTLCSETHSTGVIQDHTNEYIAIGATIAHEMGHNLGMNHDDSACRCEAESCIMAPSLSHNTPREFSSCSHQNYQDFILNNMPICMKDMPDKNFIQSTPVCGNRFTEIGEECDCGTVEECTNKCCDAATCKLKQDAQCAEGECCSDCQLKNAGSVCRPAKDDCDLSDVCDGKSGTCPSDRFQVNGSPCRNGKGYCLNGTCPTLRSQCATYWGQGSVEADDSCFEKNRIGIQGYCRQSGRKVFCLAEDVKCGVLQCKWGNDKPIAGFGYSIIPNCKSLNPEVLVENGTICGDGSVCLDGKCTTIEFAYRSFNCSAKCPGHGVCDHLMQCQCDEGWVPPNCDTKVAFNYGYIVIIVIILLIVVVVISFLLYKRTQRRKQRRSAGASFGVTNPTFNVQNQTHQTTYPYASTPQVHSRKAMYPQRPPAQSQMPQVPFNNYGNSMYPPQPPAQSQKPPVPHAFQKPSTVPPSQPVYPPFRPAYPPSRPAYPAVPPQAMKPNMRR